MIDPKILYQRLQTALRVKDYDSVLKYGGRLAEIRPHFVVVHQALGIAHNLLGNLESSLSAFHRALELKADDVETLNNLGVVYRKLGRSAEAEAYLLKASELAPNRVDVIYNLANYYKNTKSYIEAIRYYERALELSPDYIEAYNNLGTAYEQSGDVSNALRVYREGLSRDPNHPVMHYNYGVALEKSGDLSTAEEQFKTALNLRPGWASALNNLGITLQNQGKSEEAQAVLEQLLERYPDEPKYVNNFALVLNAKGMGDKAMEYYERAIDLDKSYERAAENMAELLADREDDSALARLEKLANERETNPKVAKNYGRLLQKKGHLDKAESVLRAQVENHGDDHQLAIGLGSVLVQRGKESEGQELFEQVISKDPSGELLLSVGNEYRRLGRTDVALNYGKQYLESKPKDGTGLLYMAELFRDNGQLDEAEDYLSQLDAEFRSTGRAFDVLSDVVSRHGDRTKALKTIDELITLQGTRGSSEDLRKLNQSLSMYEATSETLGAQSSEQMRNNLSRLSELHREASQRQIALAMERANQPSQEQLVPLMDMEPAMADIEDLEDLGTVEALDEDTGVLAQEMGTVQPAPAKMQFVDPSVQSAAVPGIDTPLEGDLNQLKNKLDQLTPSILDVTEEDDLREEIKPATNSELPREKAVPDFDDVEAPAGPEKRTEAIPRPSPSPPSLGTPPSSFGAPPTFAGPPSMDKLPEVELGDLVDQGEEELEPIEIEVPDYQFDPSSLGPGKVSDSPPKPQAVDHNSDPEPAQEPYTVETPAAVEGYQEPIEPKGPVEFLPELSENEFDDLLTEDEEPVMDLSPNEEDHEDAEDPMEWGATIEPVEPDFEEDIAEQSALDLSDIPEELDEVDEIEEIHGEPDYLDPSDDASFEFDTDEAPEEPKPELEPEIDDSDDSLLFESIESPDIETETESDHEDQFEPLEIEEEWESPHGHFAQGFEEPVEVAGEPAIEPRAQAVEYKSKPIKVKRVIIPIEAKVKMFDYFMNLTEHLPPEKKAEMEARGFKEKIASIKARIQGEAPRAVVGGTIGMVGEVAKVLPEAQRKDLQNKMAPVMAKLEKLRTKS